MQNTKEAYRKFLLTPFWLDLRARKIATDPRCQRCGSGKSLQAHHKFYRSDWFDTLIEDLETLCQNCHRKHHGFRRLKSKHKGKTKPKWMLGIFKHKSKKNYHRTTEIRRGGGTEYY